MRPTFTIFGDEVMLLVCGNEVWAVVEDEHAWKALQLHTVQLVRHGC